MIDHTHQMVVLLGSNIEPECHLPQAIEILRDPLEIQDVSSVWKSSAIGSEGPDFLNAAISFESQLSPQVIKQTILRPVEASLGRVRTRDKNAPRTIDLDVVVWNQRTWDKDIWQYAHAAIPVAELAPDLRRHPFQETLAQMAHKFQIESELVLHPELTQTLQLLVQSGVYAPAGQAIFPEKFEYAA